MRAPTLDGESCSYQTWWMMFKAHSKVSGFDNVLKPTIEPDVQESQEAADALDKTNADDKNKLKSVKRNGNAMDDLTLAFATK